MMDYTYSKNDFKLSKQFVDAVLSMDKVYRKSFASSDESFQEEGLVPVILTDITYDFIDNWNDIKKLFYSIYNEYKTIDNYIRKCYMFEQIASVISLGEWLFENKCSTYRKLVNSLLFVNSNPISKIQVDRDKNSLNNLLSDKNYKGSFIEKLTNWKRDNIVEPELLHDAFKEIETNAKKKAISIGFSEISDIDVKCVIEHDKPYSGYCDFKSKIIYINGDMEYTYSGLKHLIFHETHPGHMTHMQVRKILVENEIVPVDASLVITNTASSGVFEGLADNGLVFTGCVESKNDEIARLYQKLVSKVSITAAHMLHEENLGLEEVKHYFTETLCATEAAADSKIRMMTHSLRKPFIYSYWRGNEAVEDIYNKLPAYEKSEFIKYAYYNMNSINTLKMFI